METKTLRAIRYSSIDEARKVLHEALSGAAFEDPFDDEGQEPSGLLSAIPEDRLSEQLFYRLFESKMGVLVSLEKIYYSGYGPPAEEADYMGFVSENAAYVLEGRCLPISIDGCSFEARDFHQLDSLVMDGLHPINRDHLQLRLSLSPGWDFDTLFDLISQGRISAQEIDEIIHSGLT